MFSLSPHLLISSSHIALTRSIARDLSRGGEVKTSGRQSATQNK
jgi:hypothetical protein